MLQAALAAFFADVEADEWDGLRIEVARDGFGHLDIDVTQTKNGHPGMGFSL